MAYNRYNIGDIVIWDPERKPQRGAKVVGYSTLGAKVYYALQSLSIGNYFVRPEDMLEEAVLDKNNNVINKKVETIQNESDFKLGFVTGQVEQIKTGICPAVAFYPPEEEFKDYMDRIHTVCNDLLLCWDTLDTSQGTEIWIFKEESKDIFRSLSNVEEDSLEWHRIRNYLRGFSREIKRF